MLLAFVEDEVGPLPIDGERLERVRVEDDGEGVLREEGLGRGWEYGEEDKPEPDPERRRPEGRVDADAETEAVEEEEEEVDEVGAELEEEEEEI